MKRLLSLLIVFIFIHGCSEPVTPPEKIANDFYLNLLTGNFDSAFLMFSDESKEAVTIFDFKEYYTINIGRDYEFAIKELEENPIGVLSIGYPAIEIINISISGKTASVDLSAQINDIQAIASKLMTKILEKYTANISTSKELSSYAEEMIADEINKTDNDALPKINLKVLRIDLVLEKEGWKISENLAQNILLEKQKQDLIKEQQEAELKELNEKIEKQKLENERIKQEKKRKDEEELKRKQELEKEKLQYMENKVSIFDFEATRIDTYSDKNIPAVRFAIKNIGNKSLNIVKVTVVFYDRDDLPIYEKSYSPVLVSKYSISGDTPLKPNYIKREKEGRYYTIEELGPEWSGKATISVSEIEFTDDD
tara:strand:+ start:521 stop:1624 length:1104 start_codon:yes stop_codon:yes gene_type:complete